MKKLLRLLLAIFLLGLLSVLIPNYLITSNANQKTFDSINVIPKNKVGVILGASKYTSYGYINLYYKYRIEAAVKLYESGKVDFLLVSGDNSSKHYDEPSTFKEDLIAAGIPQEKIFLDYAGFRTLDSMARAKAIFGQESITVISQKFHNERAIFLAEHFKINVIGYNAKDVSSRYGLSTNLREYLARTKSIMDIIFGVEPKFYGNPIVIH